MPAIASIVIQVDEKGAVTAVNNLSNATQQIDPGLKKVGERGNVVLTDIENRSKKSTQAMQLLANATGIQLPRAMEQVLSKAPGVASALNAAFAATVVISLGKTILNVIDNLTGYSEQLAKIQQQSAAIIASTQQANTTLLGPQTLKQLDDQIISTTKGVESLREHFGLTGDAIGDALKRGLARYSASESILLDQLDHESDLLNQLYVQQAKLRDQQERLNPIEILKQQNAARLAGLEGIAKINEAERGETAIVSAEIAARVTDQKVGQAEINTIQKQAAAERAKLDRDAAIAGNQAVLEANAAAARGEEQVRLQREAKLHAIDQQELQSHIQLLDQKRAVDIQYDNQIAEIRRQAAEQTLQAEEDAAVAMALPWNRTNVQIRVDAERRIRSIQQALNDSTISEAQAARQIAAVWQQTFAQMRDNLANDLESLFDDITSGNIGKRFLSEFKKLIFQMVASWLLGLKQMQSASAGSSGSGGGLLGTILGGAFGGGGIFGGGNQPGAGGTPPFFPLIPQLQGQGGGGFALGGLGISSGQGLAGGLGSVLPAGGHDGGISGGAAIIPSGGLLSQIFSHNIFGLQGSGALLGLAGISLLTATFRKGGILGGLGGAAGGALTGFAIGGPIGAIIGGIAGFISGIFGHSTKKARLEIEAQVKKQSELIEDAFNLYQTDWGSATDQLEQIRSQGVDALRQAGVKDISRSRVGHVDHWVDLAEKHINATQQERLTREALVFGPPEFHRGGLVGAGLSRLSPGVAGAQQFHSGGVVNANLLEGEYVMRPEAVGRIGVGALDRMNGGGGGGNISINVQCVDPKNFEGWLRAGGMQKIVREWQRGELDGRW